MTTFKNILISIINIISLIAKKFKQDPPYDSILRRLLVDLLLLPSDLLSTYGAYKQSGYSLKFLCPPQTFNAQIAWSKFLNRNKQHIMLVDKLAVREHVERTVGNDLLVPLLWVGRSLDNLSLHDMPQRFVLKATHGSGMNYIVKDKNHLDFDAAKKQFDLWMKQDFSIGNGEWQYRWVEPKIIAEKYLEGANGESPEDYKFFCFKGKVFVLQIDYDRFSKHTRSFYDRSFNVLPFGILYPVNNIKPTHKPNNFEKMIEIAEGLALTESFSRVDLYNLGGKIYFGEITLHPESGSGKFLPLEWDLQLNNIIFNSY